MDNPVMKSFGAIADGTILFICKYKITTALICRYSLLPILILMICSVYANEASGESSPYNYNKDTRVSYFKEQLSSDTVSPELKLSYYDSLIYRLPTDMPTLLLKKARILRNMPGLGYKKEALTLYENMSKMEGKYGIKDNLETLYTLSSLYLQLKDPLNALIQAGRLLSYPTPDSLNYYKVKAYLAISNIFMWLEDDEKTESSVNNGLKLIEQEKEHTPVMIYSSLKSGLLTRKASLMTVKKNYSEAFELFSEAKRLFPPNANRIDVNTGAIFSEQGQHDLGNKYYMNALTSSSDEEIRGVAAFNLVLSYAQMGEYGKFWEFINQHEDDLKYMDSRIQGVTLWKLKSEAYENLDNYRAALYALRVADSIRNEVMSPENIREIEREYQQINIKEKDSEIEVLKKDMQNRNIVIWIVGGIGLLLIGGLIFMSYENRKTRLELLGEIEKHKNEEQAYLNEINSWKDRQKDMETTLELRNRKMASMAMKLGNISEKMDELKELISDPKVKKGEIVSSVQSMLRGMSSEGEVWESFMGYFEGVNQSFFDRLHVLHPDLTNAEIRMCAFILLNRTNKEIATILNRSARTVETIKYNLRKKLGITESTESYLRSISAGEKL